ncbi:MonooxygenaseFAD-binding [Penicillium desertorum]|uniref:MonooxygenaseFAD-binding n=1 Tax=Penicillium desertorum TaxID=1303715 RepID=A0A9X0BQ45_9EURO|nr:MonooxygenaseFAD-binding [Penicillium desertorum]
MAALHGESISKGGRTWSIILAMALPVALMNHFMGIASFFRLGLLSSFSAHSVKDCKLPTYEVLLLD